MSRVLSAVAWPYANGPRHIGHVAGFGVPSDVFSRYMRMAGHEVLMVSGTDEHGTPILVTADKEGKTARELADDSNRVIVEDLQGLGLSYDLFTRTTTGNHYGVVQEMFSTCLRNGYMVEQTSLSAISPSTGRTLPDRYIEGTCPICKYADARGDQCDNCGNQLDPTDLLEPRSKINGETPQFVETQHWFLDLPAVADALGEWLDGREASGTWRPNVIKFSQNILEEIRPRAMTRDIDWGIPVPGWEDQPNKRLYVWFDAVIGYLSASIEWARRLGEPEKWREWWNDTDAEAFYFMGKDNIVFHSQIWPAELLAHNGQGERGGEPGAFGVLNLPTEVVSSEFLTFGDAQFSTSRGHVIYVRDMLEGYGPDPLRYFICAAGPETSDAAFTWADFVTRNNSELVAGWGNLVNRTATMVAKNFGEVPAAGPLEEVDETVLATVRGGFESVGSLIERHRLRAAIAEAMRVVGEVNKYLTVTEPYKMKDESQRERLATVLHVALQCVSDCNTLLAPFLPHAANKVHAVLGGEGEKFPMPVIEQVDELEPDNGAGLTTYPVITGDYSATPAW
ncbi:MAG: methionine--tRNA ligase, partial [Nocardioides sp.]